MSKNPKNKTIGRLLTSRKFGKFLKKCWPTKAKPTAVNSKKVSASDSVTINVQIPTFGIRIELTWDTDDTDMDAHLIRPEGEFLDTFDDCYWNNPNPDWGTPEVSVDDPSLDQDNRSGLGPENITLEQPSEEGIYEVKVHYFTGSGLTLATVLIWIDDVKVAEYSLEMSNGDIWDCALIDWPSGEVSPGNGS